MAAKLKSTLLQDIQSAATTATLTYPSLFQIRLDPNQPRKLKLGFVPDAADGVPTPPGVRLSDVPGILAQGVPITLGSDSQITRDWREELRWLDYGQRLIQRQRNTAAAPEAAQPSTAARLWSCVQAGSAHAAGQPAWGLTPGARADALVLNPHAAATLGVPPSHLLDALVFSSPSTAWKAVMVAGRWVLQDGQHPQAAQCLQTFERAMQDLWAEG